MIHLDTNYLVDALVPGSPADVQFTSWLSSGEPVAMSTVAWGEFLCGPVTPPAEAMARQTVTQIEPLILADAERAAALFNQTGRRSRSFQNCMIAASGIRCGARLATLNQADFAVFLPHGLSLA